MKTAKKIIALIAAVTFLVNNISYALTPAVVSGDMGKNLSTRGVMAAAAEKLFSAQRGPGALGEDCFSPGRFVGEAPEVVFNGAPVEFVAADQQNPPQGWENNPLLKETDLIEAFKYFRDKEARIPEGRLEIREGYFEVDEAAGELPIARIERAGDKHVLIVHTKFVQRWNHIRENDVWFKVNPGAGRERTVSAAWGIFYRLAKHEMSDLKKAGLQPKSRGHLTYAPEKGVEVMADETEADRIAGGYAAVNGAIWMWFLSSYCFADTTRYNDLTLKERLFWFFEGVEAKKMGLDREFPALRELLDGAKVESVDEVRTAVMLARAINYHFFNDMKKVPRLKVDRKFIKEHKERGSGNTAKEHASSPGVLSGEVGPAGSDTEGRSSRPLGQNGRAMKKSLADIQVKGKRVLMRADFNVPLNERGRITDDSRIIAALPSIKYILDNGGKLILMSHLGRPGGEVKNEFRLAPVAERLSSLLKKEVRMMDDCVGEDVEDAVRGMSEGDVVLLENLRFHKQEKKNDPAFAKQLASLGEVFVDDAFGTCHRAHASTVGVTEHLLSVAGFLVQKEIEYFEQVTKDPEKPFCLMLGGAKVADKIPVIENMLDKIDFLLIGGAMAYTFLKSRHKGIGASRVEEDMIDTVNKIFEAARAKNVKILLPSDHVVAREIKENAERKVVKEHIPDDWIGLDIGPETINNYRSVLERSKTIVWNGPMGMFEMEPFSTGTRELAEFIAELGATTVIGGGDTAAAINQMELGSSMSHMSTGGGASLEYLEGKELPGIAALEDKRKHAAKTDAPGLVEVISEYIANIARDKGPGAARELGDDERQAIWQAVSMMHGTAVKIYIPNTVILTPSVKKQLRQMKNRKVPLKVIRYRAGGLAGELARESEGAKRVVIAGAEAVESIEGLLKDESKAALFRDVRVLNVQVPQKFESETKATAWQAKMMMTAVLARASHESANEVKALLCEMLKDSFARSGVDVRKFVDTLSATEDGDTNISDIARRVSYFLLETPAISLLKKLEHDLRRMKEFWTYA